MESDLPPIPASPYFVKDERGVWFLTQPAYKGDLVLRWKVDETELDRGAPPPGWVPIIAAVAESAWRRAADRYIGPFAYDTFGQRYYKILADHDGYHQALDNALAWSIWRQR